jgi:branched-chain amino acid transport system substrate-binding protein
MADDHEYVDRMFPEPVDLGIAEDDRAVSSVPFGTQAYIEGAGGEGASWWQGGGSAKDRAVQGITVYPPKRGLQTQGDPFEPMPAVFRARTTRRSSTATSGWSAKDVLWCWDH